MTDKEIRRLSRSELLQMLISQMEENEVLNEKLKKTEEELNKRCIAVEKAGSLAEAALSINEVFKAADAAASQYIENIEMLITKQETVCKNIQADAEKKALKIINDANEYKKKAKAEADNYWNQIKISVDNLLKDYQSLLNKMGVISNK
ncbi:MAG: hypothetical protein ACI4U1_02520 [Anaerovoracaceae bacterium]